MRDILHRWGQSVLLYRSGETVRIRAFLQPVEKLREQVPEVMTELGGVDGRLWLYLGGEAVEAGDRIQWNGMVFRVRSSRPWYMGEELLYWWAALEQAKEAAT